MKRKVLLLVCSLVYMSAWNSLWSQGGALSDGYFDWVKSYTGLDGLGTSNYSNAPRGIVTDSMGNVYYAGSFGLGAGVDSTQFISFELMGAHSSEGAVLAKFSPSGEMLWHRIIFNSDFYTIVHGVQMIGDTAITLLVEFDTPVQGLYRYLYFLDTMLEYESDTFFVNNDSIQKDCFTAFLTFNFDGELIERHFLQAAYFDTMGELIRWRGKVYTEELHATNFVVDDDGNITFLRWGADKPSGLEEPTVVRFIVDGHKMLDVPLAEYRGAVTEQIVKFSPHFEELLYAKYLFEPSANHLDSRHYTTFGPMLCDSAGNLYFSATMLDLNVGVSFSGVPSAVIEVGEWDKGFLVKYNSNGDFCFFKQIKYNTNTDRWIYSPFGGMALDQSDMSLFVPIDAGQNLWNYPDTCDMMVDSTVLGLPGGVGFLRFDAVTGKLLSYGCLKCDDCEIAISQAYAHTQIAVNNNRVVLPVSHKSELFCGDSLVSPSVSTSEMSSLAFWDYDGHFLDCVDMQANGEYGTTLFHDSSVYFTVMLMANSTFGNYQVDRLSHSVSAIARYVDTSFLTPYVHPIDSSQFISVPTCNGTALTVYPNPVLSTLYLEGIAEPIVAVYVSTVNGCRKQVPVRNNTVDLNGYEPGVYILEVVTDKEKYTAKVIKK